MFVIHNSALDCNKEQQYYTVPEVAKTLKVSKSYIYEMILQKKLDAIRMSERRTRIPASAIEVFVTRYMDNTYFNNYNKVVKVVLPPKRGRKPKNVS